MDPTHLIVFGETAEGTGFRPNDWPERLIDAAGAYGQDRRQGRGGHRGPERRHGQIDFLTAQMRDGRKCLVIDLRLRAANPAAFAYLVNFARGNRLRTDPPLEALGP